MTIADSENEEGVENREPPEGFLEPGYITYRGKTGKMWEKLQKRRKEKEQREAADED